MTDLPQGTVTLVFTDIEGSTRLLASLGSRYEAVLAEHRTLLRAAFQSHAGTEVDTQGDALFYAFAKAHDAVTAAAEAQRALASHDFGSGAQLKVRMGIHTGEPTLTQEGYVGSDVHLGARICAAAWGGQIVVSSATAALLSAGLKDVTVRSLGHHALKDIDERVELYQVVAPGLTHDFPTLRTVGFHPTNLPPRLAPLIGRERELAYLTELLGSPETTVVTLVGPGGTGKTTLAANLGAEVLSTFPDGVFFVDLSALNDSFLVVPSIAQVLALKETPGRTLEQSLADHLSFKEMLMILDNFEQVIEAASEVSSLLTQAPSLKVVVTSREVLHIAGERVVSLAPLELPSPDHDDVGEVSRAAAVALFTERARAVKADFTLTADNASNVAAICRRLDGLPLALELAAARTNLLSPAALLVRLESGLKVLTSGRRDAAERQKTLEGAIEWSYGLLTSEEQTLFRRLGVFAGGLSLEAAEQVCERGDLDLDVLDGLASLVDKSLVRAAREQERFFLLETIREFALEELKKCGEADDIRRTHVEFFRRLAEDAWWNLIGAEAEVWLRRLDTDLANLRSALDHGVMHAPEVALATAGALWRFWWARGYLDEGRTFLEKTLRSGIGSKPARARALRGLGAIAQAQGDNVAGAAVTLEALSLFEQIDDRGGQARCWETLAFVAQEEGDFSTAGTRFKRARRLYAEEGDEAGIAGAIGNLGNLALLQGDLEEAYRLAQMTMKLAGKLRHVEGVAQSLINMGFSKLAQETSAEAAELFAQGLRLAREVDHKELTAVALEGSAAAAVAVGDMSLGTSLLDEADKLRKQSGHKRELLETRVYERTRRRLRANREQNAARDAKSSGAPPMHSA